MKIQVLLSTMNLENEKQHKELIKKMNIKTESLTINQITKKEIKKWGKDNVEHKIKSYYERGLAKSRNKAIKNSSCDIAMIADDDVIYEDNYEKIVKNGYEKYPDADIIIFDVEVENENRKTNKIKEGKISYLGVIKVFSPEITFKVKNLNILFDEDFGAGSIYNHGEENILLFDAIRKKLKIYHYPKKIAIAKQEESTWYKEPFDRDFLEQQGVCYYRMSTKFYLFFVIWFAYKKRKKYINKGKSFEMIYHMLIGIKKYKKLKSKDCKKWGK